MTSPTNRDARERLAAALERLANAADCYGVAHLDTDDLDKDAEELQAATLAARALLSPDEVEGMGSDQPLPSVATGHPEQGALLSGWREADLGWLRRLVKRQSYTGHCGEENADIRARQDNDDRIERILALLTSPPKGGE